MLPLRGRRLQTSSSPVVTLTFGQKENQFKKSKKIKAGELEPSRREAITRGLGKLQLKNRRRQQALANKSLGLCLANYGGGSSASYFVLSFRAIHVFGISDERIEGGTSSSSSSSDQLSRFQQVQFPSSEDGNCYGMGCATSGSKLYLVGGQKKEKESSDSSSSSSSNTERDDTAPHESLVSSETEREDTAVFESCDSDTKGEEAPPVLRFSLYDYSPKVFMLDLANFELYEASEDEKMLSGMASPLIIVVEEKLYVLAGTPVSMLPKYPFEVHDSKKKDSWKKLPSPPFLKPDSKFFQDPQIRSYVVIDNKIHVSTSSSSFSFDMTIEKWTPCTLFDEDNNHLKLHPQRRVDTRYPTHFGWIKHPLNNNKDEQGYGLPFEFNGGAVMYGGNVMICLVQSRGVVAYKLVDGKVINTQELEGLEIPSSATSSFLADFGEGYLCLLSVSNNDEPKKDFKISITPFEVSKVKYELRQKGKLKKFLNCLIGKKFIHSPPSANQLRPGNIWSPIGCYVV